jgi:hypothetical protein
MTALFFALGCAAVRAPESEARSARLPAPVERILADLSFQFTVADGANAEVYRSTGPYEIVAIADSRVEMRGFDSRRLKPTTTVFEFEGDQVWATVSIGDRDFLTRIR